MKIYVIVKVCYDYYRFQENISATTDLEKAIEIAKLNVNDWNKFIVTGIEKSNEFDESEKAHILIQTFEQP